MILNDQTMKNLIICCSVLLLAACRVQKPSQPIAPEVLNENYSLKKSSEVIDSVKYRETILQNKAKYIGKPFSAFLKDLKIEIKSYSLSRHQRISFFGILISFDDRATTQSKGAGDHGLPPPVQLHIIWEENIPQAKLPTTLTQIEWTKAEVDYFSTMIIKDIM